MNRWISVIRAVERNSRKSGRALGAKNMGTQKTTAIRLACVKCAKHHLTTDCPHKDKIENVKCWVTVRITTVRITTQQTTKIALQEDNYRKECFLHWGNKHS